MQYGAIIKRAFSTAWEHKYLWILGFFVGGTGVSGFNQIREYHLSANSKVEDLALVLLLLLFVILLVVTFFILSRICSGGLIANAARIRRGEPHSLSEAWSDGRRYFWRMLGLLLGAILVYLAFLAIAIIIGIILFAIHKVLFFLGLLVLIPLSLAFFFFAALVLALAERFIILDDQSVFTAIESGFGLLKSKLGNSVGMGLLAVIINIPLTIALIIFALVLSLPLIGLAMISVAWTVLYGLFIVLPPIIIAGSYIDTYRSCLWTFFFLELHGETAIAFERANPSPDLPMSLHPPQFE